MDHLPPEEAWIESYVNFWLQKDDFSITFKKQSRVGPLLTVLVPSTKKGDVKAGIDAAGEIFCRSVYHDVTLMHHVYQFLEAGYDIDQIADNDELEKLKQDIGEEEAEELVQFFAYSVSDHNPEFDHLEYPD